MSRKKATGSQVVAKSLANELTEATIEELIGTPAHTLKAKTSIHDLQPRIYPQMAPYLRAGPAIDDNDVGGEVVGAPDQRGADAVGVDRDALALERPDPLDVEPAGADDPDCNEALGVE